MRCDERIRPGSSLWAWSFKYMRGSGLAASRVRVSVRYEVFPGRSPGPGGPESLNYRARRVNGARPGGARGPRDQALAAMSKPFRSTVPAAIVAAAACALGLAQAPQESGATLRERIERLRGEGEAAEAEMASLPQLGEEAALAALDGLASAGPLERRRRAHLVFLAGGGRAIEPAI